MNGTRLAELAEPLQEQRMTDHPTDPSTNPATKPASNLTSTMEIQLEGRLVAKCGVDAMAGHSGPESISRVDWVPPNDEPHV